MCRRLDTLFARAALMPGVERLIRHLHRPFGSFWHAAGRGSPRHGVPMAVATSSHRRHFELKTSLHRELFHLMHHIVCGDQVSRSKPAPEIFLTAKERFAAVPKVDQVLVFEDAPSGVEAGLAAGMQVCHVPDAKLSRSSCGKAHCELLSLEDRYSIYSLWHPRAVKKPFGVSKPGLSPRRVGFAAFLSERERSFRAFRSSCEAWQGLF